MRSVTFTEDKRTAIEHVLKGAAGGQGANNIEGLLLHIKDDHSLVSRIALKLNDIKHSEKVMYKVNLSNLGATFTKCPQRDNIYYYRWSPSVGAAQCTGVCPSRILAKYVIKHDGTVMVCSGQANTKLKSCRYEIRLAK